MLRQQLGSGYKVTPQSAASQDRLTVSHGAAFASVRLARDENATTFRVHGRGWPGLWSASSASPRP